MNNERDCRIIVRITLSLSGISALTAVALTWTAASSSLWGGLMLGGLALLNLGGAAILLFMACGFASMGMPKDH